MAKFDFNLDEFSCPNSGCSQSGLKREGSIANCPQRLWQEKQRPLIAISAEIVLRRHLGHFSLELICQRKRYKISFARLPRAFALRQDC
jgi:hypothetical protein